MSSYKSNAPRRTAESTTELTSNTKLQEKVSKLQELFSTWSNDDLHSVLAETGGDVELAAARISEGHAEQWGSVTRKREKKAQHSTAPHSSRPDRERHNGESRGGSRGARGGRGRGGSGRGALRAPAHSSHHSHSKELSDTVTSTVTNAFSTTAPLAISEHTTDSATAAASSMISVEPKTDASGAGAETSVPSTLSHHDSGSMPEANEPTFNSTPMIALTEPAFIPKPQPSIAKAATGSKLSWAQIARPQDKSKITPPPPAPSRQSLPSTSIPTAPIAPATDTIPPPSEPFEASIWEEPTTVQTPPTWEEESVPTLPAPLPQTPQVVENRVPTTTTATTSTTGATNDGWISAEAVAQALPKQDSWELKPSLSAASPPTSTQESAWSQTQAASELSTNTTVTIDTFSTSSSIVPSASTASVPTSTSVSSKPPTPSVAHARPPGIHKSNAKFSKDQAVFISAFAGNVTPNADKLGMQFGSLSLNGDDTFDSATKTDNDSATVVTPEAPKQILLQSQRAQVAVQTQPQEPVQSTSTTTSANTHTQATYSQTTPQQHAPPSVVPIQAQQIQQAAQTSQPLPPVASFASHPSVASNPAPQQQQPLPAPQHQQHSQHSYGHHQQNVHFDGPQLQNPHGAGSQNSSYFRHDAPFYHTPTPPQNPPDHQSGYPAAFSPVGMGTSLHGHSQNLGAQNITHLGGFNGISGGEYGYNDGQRNFYDYVPSNFNSRLGHDEPGKTGLPLTQGNQPTSVLGSGTSQTQNTNGHQSSTTQPPTGQQNQQGYPPMQFFYPTFFPNTYHPPPYPNTSYTQPYVPKFPVYPQGPVGPGSAPSGKGISGGPYNPSGSQNHLYHGQSGFDDSSNGYSHPQNTSNLGTADFQKQTSHHHQQPQQLYSGQQNQGLQSFLNMQQTGGAGQSVGTAGQSRSGTSPETSYKHYGGGGAPDKSNVGLTQSAQQNRGASSQQGQQQGGSFYPSNRFGNAGGPQQQSQQQGYAQGSEQGQFYSYQHRHQAYWQ